MKKCDICSQVGNTDIAKWFNRKIKPHFDKSIFCNVLSCLFLKKTLSADFQTGTFVSCSAERNN